MTINLPGIILFIFLLFSFSCFAQGKRNSVSLEIGKPGLIYNLHFAHNIKTHSGIRFFIGSNFSKYLSAFNVGSGGYKLFGKQKHFLELGVDVGYLKIDENSDDQRGFSFVYPNYSVNTYYFTANIGYRRSSDQTLFRMGISPGYIKNKVLPGGFVSFGVRF